MSADTSDISSYSVLTELHQFPLHKPAGISATLGGFGMQGTLDKQSPLPGVARKVTGPPVPGIYVYICSFQ